MSIENFNRFFRNLGKFQIKNRFAFLVILAVITAFGVCGITKLEFESGANGFLDNSDDVKKIRTILKRFSVTKIL